MPGLGVAGRDTGARLLLKREPNRCACSDSHPETGMALLNHPFSCRNLAAGCEAGVHRGPAGSAVVPVRRALCGRVYTGSKVLAQAQLIEVFLLLRCVINKQIGCPSAAYFWLGPQQAVFVATRVFCPLPSPGFARQRSGCEWSSCPLIYYVLSRTARRLAHHLRPSEGRQMANPNVRLWAREVGGRIPGLGTWPERARSLCWSSSSAGGTADIQPRLSLLSIWHRGQKVAGGARRLLRRVI